MLPASDRYGRYQLRGDLGRGGFAVVYRAWDPEHQREVALKALLPHLAEDDEIRDRFLAEAQATADLHHPNIVSVIEVNQVRDLPYFTMELINGVTLAALPDAKDGLPLLQVSEIVRALASAIDYLHSRRVVHRDIKASNVMLDASGRTVLMDFGVARALDRTQFTRTGVSVGTPEAMAPEQVRGTVVGPSADIYALGVLAYRLLAGRPPFVGDTMYVLHAHAYDTPPPLRQFRPGLPEPVYAAIDAALMKEPLDRPATAMEFASGLTPPAEASSEALSAGFVRMPQRSPAAEPEALEARPARHELVPIATEPAPAPRTATIDNVRTEPAHPGHGSTPEQESGQDRDRTEAGLPPFARQRPPAQAMPLPDNGPPRTAAPASPLVAAQATTEERTRNRAGKAASGKLPWKLIGAGIAALVLLGAGALIAIAGRGSQTPGPASPTAASSAALPIATPPTIAPTTAVPSTRTAAVPAAATAAGTVYATATSAGSRTATVAPRASATAAPTSGPTASVTAPPAFTARVLAGSGAPGFQDGQGEQAQLNGPKGVGVETSGAIVVADTDNSRIRRIGADGRVSTIAGPAQANGAAAGYVDQAGAAACFNKPRGIFIDTNGYRTERDGSIYVADTGNNRIRRIDGSGQVSTIAGSGGTDVGGGGYADGPGTQARFNLPTGIVGASDGSLYVTDQRNNAIRRIDRTGAVSTLAGSPTRGNADGNGAAATFDNPSAVAIDGQGNLFVADTFNGLIRRITPDGQVSTYAGGGSRNTLEGAARDVGFVFPEGIAVDSAGNVYVADQTHTIRKIAPNGTVVIVAGGTEGYVNGAGKQARFDFPSGLALAGDGTLLVADTTNNRVRAVDVR